MKKPIGVIITDTHLKESNIETVKSIFRQATEIAKGLGLTSISHGGDIFDSRRSQSQLILTSFRDILDQLQEDGMLLKSIKGNHDCTEYSISKSFLEPFAHHPAFELYPISHSTQLPGRIMLHYLSHFSEIVYISHLTELSQKASDKNFNHILLTHTDVNSGRMNNGTIIHNNITTDLFAPFDLVLIGHWHDYQEMDNGRIKFIGAALQHNHGELTGKGATILYDDLSTEIVPLKYPQYIKYEVNPKDLTAKDLADLALEKKETGDNYKIVLTGTDAENKSFNKKLLIECGVKVETKAQDITKEEIEEQVEAFSITSLKEEFEAFCEKNKLDVATGMKYFNKIIAA